MEGHVELLFRRFPKQFTKQNIQDFLQYFGGKDIKCFSKYGKMKNCAFATFPNFDIANHVLQKLHQKLILESRIFVEFARKENLTSNDVQEELLEKNNSIPQLNDSTKLKNLKTEPKSFISLKYKYPPLNSDILINICSAIIATPALYTQILHLMNKMNLPLPFMPSMVVPSMIKDHCMKTLNFNVRSPSVASSESEIETEEIMDENLTVPERAKLHRKIQHISRKRKFDFGVSKQTVVPDKQRKVSLKSLFAVKHLTSKNITINQIEMNNGKISAPKKDPMSTSGFGKLEKTNEDQKDTDNLNKELNYSTMDFITHKQLSACRLSNKEMREHQLFKNYKQGEPTCRLYIKNLSKQVKEKDLAFLFGRYVDFTVESQSNMFDIRLMQQGRMKGQAFVTLHNVKKASQAITECNGYQLMNKPMVIQFARSAKPKQMIA